MHGGREGVRGKKGGGGGSFPVWTTIKGPKKWIAAATFGGGATSTWQMNESHGCLPRGMKGGIDGQVTLSCSA